MGLVNKILEAMGEVALFQCEFEREEPDSVLFANECRRMKEVGIPLHHCAQSLDEARRLGATIPQHQIDDFNREVKLLLDNIAFLRSLLEINRQNRKLPALQQPFNLYSSSGSECQNSSTSSSSPNSTALERHLEASRNSGLRSVRFAPEVESISNARSDTFGPRVRNLGGDRGEEGNYEPYQQNHPLASSLSLTGRNVLRDVFPSTTPTVFRREAAPALEAFSAGYWSPSSSTSSLSPASSLIRFHSDSS